MTKLDVNLVESRLLEIKLDVDGKNASIVLATTLDARVHMSLAGIKRLLVSELREQNIIESFDCWTGSTQCARAREAIFYLVAGCPETDCEPSIKEVVQEQYAEVLSGRLHLVELAAIYGAQVLALCETVSLSKL